MFGICLSPVKINQTKNQFNMKSVLFILCTLLSFELSAQQIPSDAVYQNIVREYILNDDGSIEYHYYKKLKLNTHFAFNRLYGETFIVYNPQYQTLKINKAITTQADGNEVKSPDNSFNEVLPHLAANAPPYNHLREMVVTHTGLEVGATIELDYSIISKPGYYPGLMEDIVLTETSPVEKEVIIIKIPASMELSYQVQNLRTAPEIKDAKGRKDYIFTFSALAEQTHEQHQSSMDVDLPRLTFSTIGYSEMIAQFVKQASFSLKINAEMQKLVKTSKAKSKSDMDQVLALQKEICDNLNTWPIPLDFSGYKVRTPIETWESNGGTPIEKSLLLVALFRNAGINAYTAFAIPTRLYSAKTACFNLASEVLVIVSPRESEQMFISAYQKTDQNYIYSLQGQTIVYLEEKDIPQVNVSDKFENKVVTNGSFLISDNFELSGTMECLLTENRNPYYSIHVDSSLIKSFIGGGILKKDILEAHPINSAQYRSLIDYKIQSKAAFRKQANHYFWEIPENTWGTNAWHLPYMNNERNSILELPNSINEQYSYDITVPEGVTLVNPLELISKKTAFGELVLSTVQEKNKVVVKRMFVINTNTISVSDYAEFKEMVDLWNEKNFRNLIFKK